MHNNVFVDNLYHSGAMTLISSLPIKVRLQNVGSFKHLPSKQTCLPCLHSLLSQVSHKIPCIYNVDTQLMYPSFLYLLPSQTSHKLYSAHRFKSGPTFCSCSQARVHNFHWNPMLKTCQVSMFPEELRGISKQVLLYKNSLNPGQRSLA